MRWGTITAVVIALAACAPSSSPQVFAGEWEYGFEQDRFREPGKSYRNDWGWCLRCATEGGCGELVAGLLNGDGVIPLTNRPHRLHVVVEGTLSPESAAGYGHMGLCEREVLVTRVREARVLELVEP